MALKDTITRVLGSGWHVNSVAFLTALIPATDGAPEAGKVVTTDASNKVASIDVTSLKLGGTAVTATAAQLNTSVNGLTATAAQINRVALLPDAQYSTAALQSTVAPAANIAGAKNVAFENTGVTPANLQFDTAANIVAAIPGAIIGQAYILEIRNSSSGANTATMTTNTGLTLHGTMTIAQNVTRRFVVVLTSLSAIDIFSMGVSAAAV